MRTCSTPSMPPFKNSRNRPSRCVPNGAIPSERRGIPPKSGRASRQRLVKHKAQSNPANDAPNSQKHRKGPAPNAQLVIITGLSGSGKGSVLKVFEDLGYYSVDNLPIGLIPKFAELTRDSASIRFSALVVDIREGHSLKRFPAIYARIRREIPTRLVFMDADDDTIQRR